MSRILRLEPASQPQHLRVESKKLERVTYRSSLYGSAPRYLAACCVPFLTTASRQHLCSTAGHQLVIPSHRLTTYDRRAFSVAGPMFWNSLPRSLHDPSYTAAVFGWSLKTFLLSEYLYTQCIRGICDDALYKLMFYLLTVCSAQLSLLPSAGREMSSNSPVNFACTR